MPPEHPTPDPRQADVELVRGVLAGDTAAVEAFFQRMLFVPRLLHLLNGRRSPRLTHDDLADLTAETVGIAWRKLATFRHESSLETWVSRIARFELSNALRRQRHTVPLDDLEESVILARPIGDAGPDLELVHRAIDALPPEQADVIRLRFFDGLSFPEIAERIAVPTATAKTRYRRGLERLRPRFATWLREEHA